MRMLADIGLAVAAAQVDIAAAQVDIAAAEVGLVAGVGGRGSGWACGLRKRAEQRVWVVGSARRSRACRASFRGRPWPRGRRRGFAAGESLRTG